MTTTIELAEDPVAIDEATEMVAKAQLRRLATPPARLVRLPIALTYRSTGWMLRQLDRLTGDFIWLDDEYDDLIERDEIPVSVTVPDLPGEVTITESGETQ